MRSVVKPGRHVLLAMLLCWQLAACGASGTGASTVVPSPPPGSPRPSAASPVASASPSSSAPATLSPVPTPTPLIPLTPTGSGGLAELTKIPLPGPAGRGTAILDNPTARQVYLGRAEPGLVAINLADQTIAKTVSSISDPSGIAEDGKFLYVTSAQDNRLAAVATTTWSITGTVKTEGSEPGGIWADPSDNQLAVLGVGSRDVEIYTPGPEPAWRATYRLPTSAAPRPGAGALDPSNHVLYVAAGSTIFGVELRTGRVRQVADLQPSTVAIASLAYDGRTNDVWAATTGGQLVVLSAASGKVIKTLPAPDHDEIAFDPTLRFMFTFGEHGFWAYDTNTNAPWSRVDLAAPEGAVGAVDPDSHDLYVYVGGENAVTVFYWPGAGGTGATSATGSSTTGSSAVGSSATGSGAATGGTTGTGGATAPSAAGGGGAATTGAGGGTSGASGTGAGGTGAGGSSAVVIPSSPTSIGAGAAGPSAPALGGTGASTAAGGTGVSTPVPIPTPIPIGTPVPLGGAAGGTLGAGQSSGSLGTAPSPAGSGIGGTSAPTPIGGGPSGGSLGSPGTAPTSPGLSSSTPAGGGTGPGSGVGASNPVGSSVPTSVP